MRKFLFFLFLLAGGTLQAQQQVVDSLLVELSKAQTDSARVMLNSQLSEQYFRFDLPKAITYGEVAEKLAAKIKFSKGQAKALNALGISHMIMADYDKALEAHFKALKIREQLKDTAYIVASYTNIGNVYYKSLDPDRAIKYYKIASSLAEKINDKLGLSRLYNNLGSFSEGSGNIKEALIYFEKASKIKQELGDRPGYAVTLHHMGTIHLREGHPQKALPHLFLAKRVNEELNDEISNLAVYRSLAEAYLAMNNLPEALKYATWSYEKSKVTKSNNEIAVSADQMREIALRMGDHKLAYDYLEVGTVAGDDMHNENTQRIREEMTAKFELEKKDLENQKLLIEKRQQADLLEQKNWVQLLELAVIFLMSALLVVLFMSRRRAKVANLKLHEINEQIQLKNYKIEALAEALQEKNAQLEQSSAFKNKILSIISHDLRSPLASMKALFTLALRKPMGEAEVKHVFGLLHREAEVISNMLNNLLVWAKAQMEGGEVQLGPVNVYSLAVANLALISNQAQQKGIALTNKVPADVLVLADKERLNFVLRNLMMNAIKFSFEGGEVQVLLKEQDGDLLIGVKDNGMGIPAEHFSKLFSEERFTTLGTAREKGTGLGLMLCMEFIESIGGTITVESEEGKGSTFYISLPKVEEAVAAKVEELSLA